MKDTIYLTYGKFSILHLGHEIILNNFLAHIYDNSNGSFKDHLNLLSSSGMSSKIDWCKLIYPELNWTQIDIFDVLQQLDKKGYRKVYLFVGPDRRQHWETVLNSQNFKLFSFTKIKVHSIGYPRVDIPYDELLNNEAVPEYASSSLMRKFVKNNNYDMFVKYLPNRFKSREDFAVLANKLWNDVKESQSVDFSVLANKNN